MLSITPYKGKLPCPSCKSDEHKSPEIIFQGIHFLAHIICSNCDTEYYHTLPTAHDYYFPISFSKNNRFKSYAPEAKDWLAEPLIQSVLLPNIISPSITKKTFFKTERPILLNCIDFCYGHSLLKLSNATHYLQRFPEKGIIVIVPASFEWMLPEGIAEVWLVNEKLGNLNKYISTLQPLFQEIIQKYATVELCTVNIHPDTISINWDVYFKTKKFNYSNFYSEPPTITFIHREDRLWLKNNVEQLIWKVLKRTPLKNIAHKILIARQTFLFAKTATQIKKIYPTAIFNLAGLGIPSYAPSILKEYRASKPTGELELDWCKLYSSSHIVIGVHGSNMLIPTALSAAFVELLPRHKILRVTEDVIQTIPNRNAQYLGRYVDEFSSPKLVAAHAISIIQNYGFFADTIQWRD